MTARRATRADSSAWTWLPEFAAETLPRYTSYPPANRFTAGTGPADADAAIMALAPGSRLSLYVHIPFCRALCWYCGCHTSVPTRANPVDQYLVALGQEIDRIASIAPTSCIVTHLHFGGGSPDILSPQQVDDLFARLRAGFRFSPTAELAAELDPRGASAELVAAFAANGLTRVSFGVQTLDAGIQQRINRIQPPQDVASAVARVRAAGIRNVNLDLMYGLPGQTVQHVIDSATFAALADADRVAVFGYAHVPWFKKHQAAIQESDLPGGEDRFRQAEAAARTLENAGYIPVGFDHFAAPGDSLAEADKSGALRRNFQGYTADAADALIGFGASSISSLPGLHVQNTTDTAAYRRAAAEGRSAAVRGIAVSPADARTGALIERILCRFEADVPADMRIAACPALSRLESAGLIMFVRNRLVVTAKGRPYVRNIAAAFDPGMNAKPAVTGASAAPRHSLAV